MAEHRATDFVCLLSLLVTGTLALRLWDPRDSSLYTNYSLDSAAICNPSTDKVQDVVDLRTRRDSAIVINPSHSFDSWRGFVYNKHCRFKVKAFKGDGLFVVVQSMSLRKNGSECIDFIRFLSENGGSSKKYCGQVDSRMPDSDRVDEFSATGKITTEIFFSKQPLLPGERLDLLITYTPYKASFCRFSTYLDFSSVFNSYPSRDCLINPNFVCDLYTNCYKPLCYDEGNCTNRESTNIVSDGTGTKVTISAVTTIFLCFIIFVLCLWICRKHKKLCWSPDCAGPSRGPPAAVSGSTVGLPMERGNRNAPSAPYVSSAPMLEVAVPTSVNNKDLPPSYDSLFPNQSNTANT